jgi:hypothetical protein
VGLQTSLERVLNNIWGIAIALTLTIFVICVIIAGIMRMVSFGNERRVAISNMALTAAVVGLVIALLALILRDWLTGLLAPPKPTNHVIQQVVIKQPDTRQVIKQSDTQEVFFIKEKLPEVFPGRFAHSESREEG